MATATDRATPILFFFYTDAPTTEIYTLSLHDALPISPPCAGTATISTPAGSFGATPSAVTRSEEHTSELQSHVNLVCRLLLEKKKKQVNTLASSHTHNKNKI